MGSVGLSKFDMRLKVVVFLFSMVVSAEAAMAKNSKSRVADFFLGQMAKRHSVSIHDRAFQGNIPMSKWGQRPVRRSMESEMSMLGNYANNPMIAQAQADFVNCYESMGDTETCWSLVKPQVIEALTDMNII